MTEAEITSLKMRWLNNQDFVHIKQRLFNPEPNDNWYPDCPKIEHGYETTNNIPDITGDFRGIDGSKLNFGYHFDLSGMRFDYANFDEANFDEACLQGAVLSHASFRNAHFRFTHMLPLYGEHVDFTGAIFNKPVIEWAKLSECIFNHTHIHNEDSTRTGGISASILTLSQFKYAKIEGTKLDICDFRGSDFSHATIKDTDLRLSNFRDCIFQNAIIENCDMNGTDFRGCDLRNLKIKGGMFNTQLDVENRQQIVRFPKFDDTPLARQIVAESGAANQEVIAWYAVPKNYVPNAIQQPATPVETPPQEPTLRALPGEAVPKAGKWYSPAFKNGEQILTLNAGDSLPSTDYTEYGAVYWYLMPESI